MTDYSDPGTVDGITFGLDGTIYAEAGQPPRVDGDPRAELSDYAGRLRAAWLDHPKAFPLLSPTSRE